MKREAKSKGEKERYTHLNAEFQTIARRNKKAFLSNRCKEIEESKRVGKTRGHSRKLERPREHFMKDGHKKGLNWQGPDRSRKN